MFYNLVNYIFEYIYIILSPISQWYSQLETFNVDVGSLEQELSELNEELLVSDRQFHHIRASIMKFQISSAIQFGRDAAESVAALKIAELTRNLGTASRRAAYLADEAAKTQVLMLLVWMIGI